MVKNLSTIDRSEKVRIGKHMPSEQALNSIVLNASSNIIEAPNPGLYMAPVRMGGSSTSNALAYDSQTHEIVDTGLTPETTLQGVITYGNTTTLTTEFNNVATGLVTIGNVGIANANPIHTLDIGSNVSIDDDGSNVLDVRGNVFVSQTTFITGNLHVLGDTTLVSKQNLIVDDGIVEIGQNNYDSLSATDLGFVMTRSPTEANVALGFTESDDVFILAHTQSSADGNHLVPDTSNLISMRVYGNVAADRFEGDGGLLSNIASNLENIVNNGNVSSNVIQLTNATDGLVATGNVTAAYFKGDGSKLTGLVTTLQDVADNGNVTDNVLQLTNATDGLVATGNVTAAYFKGDGTHVTNVLHMNEFDSHAANIRSEMAANTVTMYSNLSANVAAIRDEMAANTVTMYSNLSANVAAIRDEMAANTVTMYSNLSANVAAIRTEMASNTVTTRNFSMFLIASNVSMIKGLMAANTATMYSNLSANVAAIRTEMTANTLAMQSNLDSNVTRIAVLESEGLSHIVDRNNVSSNTIQLTNATDGLVATGNVTALYFKGDGSELANIASNLEQIVNNGNVSSNTLQFINTGTSLVTSGKVGVNQTTPQKTLHVGGEILADDDITGVDFFGDDATFTGNVTTDGLVATANITASYFKGDGSELTGLSSTLQQVSDNSNITSNTIQLTNATDGLVATGNVTAAYFKGDGSELTGVSSTLQQVSDNSNITSNTIQLTNATDGLVATGNVTAAYFKGDGSELTGLVTNLQDVSDNGNVTNNVLQLTNATDGLVATGNVTAAYFKGDGSKLTGLVTDLESVIMNGNTTSNIVEFHGPVVSIITSNSVGVKNANPLHDFSVGTNVFVDDIASNILTVDGNILAHAITLDTIKLGAGHGLETVVMLSNATSNVVEFNNATSFVTASNVGIANAAATHTMDIGANVYIDDTGSNVLHVIGNTYSSIVTGGKIAISNSAPTKDLSVGSNLYVDEYGSNVLIVEGNVSIGTKLTLGSIDITTGQTLDHVVNQSNVTDNVLQLTNITDGLVATGNVTAAYFKGDGSELTGLSSTLQQVTDNSNITNNVVQLTNATDGLVATGNVTAAYFKGDGSELTGLSSTLQQVTDNSNITNNVVQLTNATDGLVATGNVTAAYFKGDGTQLTGIALATDLTQAIVEIDSNAARVGTLETNLTQAIVEIDSNAARVGTLESGLTQAIVEIDSNAARVGTLESGLTQAIVEIDSNAARIGTLEDSTMSIGGVKTFTGDVILEANLKVSGNVFYANTHNLIVSDPIMELGANNQHSNDLGIVMVRHDGAASNVSMSYDESDDILRFGYTDDSAYGSTIANTSDKLAVSITGNVAAAYDTDTTSYFGRVAVGYMGQSDQASFSHLDKNTSVNFALKQAASGATHLNTPTGQHIRFSVNASEVGRFTGGGDFKVGSNKLYVDTSASEVQMYSQATGSTAGPDLLLMRDNPNNGSNGDYIGQIRYEGLNDNGNSLLYAKTTGKIKTATNGSEDGVIETMIKTGGSNRLSVRHSGAKFLIQKGTDLQVGEVANLYVDTSTSRVGINVASPSYTLDVDGDINLSTGSTLRINGTPAVFSNWTVGGSDIYRSSGNIGIGTASPGQKLSIYTGSTSTSALSFDRYSTGNYRTDIYQNSYGPDFRVGHGAYTPESILYLKRLSGGNKEVEINGSVGIGTATPDGPLHVFKLGNTAAAPGGGIKMERDSNYGCAIWHEYPSGGSADCMCFRTVAGATDAYGGTPQMVLTHQGNVGIGTVSPGDKLELYSSGASDNVGMITKNGTRQWRVGVRGDTSSVFAIQDDTAGAMRMVINGNGNVGIGTVSPGEKLHVHENLNTSGHQICARIGGSASSSYNTLVFGSKDGRPHIGGHRSDYGMWADLSFQDDLMVLKQSNMCAGVGTINPRASLQIGKHIPNNSGTNSTIPSSNMGQNVNMPNSTRLWMANRFTSTEEDYWGCAMGVLYDGPTYIQSINKKTSAVYDLLLQPNGGNVGIGTATPGCSLEVWDVSTNPGFRVFIGTNEAINMSGGGNLYRHWHVGGSTWNGSGLLFGGWEVLPANMWGSSVNNQITFGSGTRRWHILFSQNALNTASDDRLKHNEVEVANALGTINKLKLLKYDKTSQMLDADYNGDLTDIPHTKEVGFIAQDVLEIPELSFLVSVPDDPEEEISIGTDRVEKRGEGTYGLDYQGIHNILVQAVQELSTKNDTLETELQAEKTKTATLETQVAALLARVTALENA